MKNILPKILVILGPTATGKSDLAVEIAQRFNGEIISADSRQVFKDMDLGTGKITKKEMLGVKHYMLDIVKPNTKYNVAKYQKEVHGIIADILGRDKLPIICGGTGFYIQAIVDNVIFPEVKSDEKLRVKLEKLTTNKLLIILEKLDKNTFNRIDKNNRVRIVRAIEIAKTLGFVPPIKKDIKYNSLQLGLDANDEILKDRIHKRLIKRLDNGMLKEVSKLHSQSVTWKRLENFGLEYRYLALYLQKKITHEQMINELCMAIWHFAKRQRTWFKRDNRIKWFKLEDKKEIIKTIDQFML
ncbi:MAG: tRNA (adenosine(37)-N6)-dimethylallyltransferase MiaA [bacterium]